MKDYMVRATAANAQIRAFACTTRETVETARASHNTSPVVTAALGRLLSAGAMMGSMLKGDDELITLQRGERKKTEVGNCRRMEKSTSRRKESRLHS
jgi:redox-regulated HSP33 family molecular chaperone